MKNLKKVLALVLAVVMIMGTVAVASAKTYTDVKSSDNYADAIDILSTLGILDGFEDGTFKSEGNLNREQAAKLVAIVHNAATNNKIQSNIADLYSNAQNPFVDCNASWALPYINYCRITGLADGMTATTYAPKRQLTGVQWLKLMLTTLGFDTGKEGYTGTGWDVNVLNRANEIGLTAGLAKGWKGIAPITRGEAAQILVNAMQAYLVEYGQLVKEYPGNATIRPIAKAFISNEQVNKTGTRLAEKMGLTITLKYDVFGRPGYLWTYRNGWSKFYMSAPLASYNTAVSDCDLLVAAGYEKTSKETMNYYEFVNGVLSTKSLTHVNKACYGTAHGDTGALTQLFYVPGVGFIVTRIDTYLAQVTGVTTNAAHGNNGGYSNLNVYLAGTKFDNDPTAYNTVSGLYSYARGSYILVNISDMVPAGLAAPFYGNIYDLDTVVETSATSTESHDVYTVGAQYLVDVKQADSKDQKLTGRSLNATAALLTVDGTQTATAVKYGLDVADVDATPFAAINGTYKFFRDQYDNLIGDKKIATEYSYGVVTGIVWITNGASYSDAQFASAGFVKAGANEAADIKVVKAGNTDANVGDVYGTESNAQGSYMNRSVSTVKALNQDYTNNYNQGNKFGVVKYSESDGAYTLVYNDSTVNVLGVSGTWGLDISATKPQLSNGYIADENTIFTVRTNVGGKDVYTSYTGIKNVPTIKGATVVAVLEAGADFVSFVYVDARNAIFAGSTTVAYVYNNLVNYEENGVYYTYNNLFINGELTSINVPTSVVAGNPAALFANTGLYKLSYNADATQVIKADPITTNYVSGKIDSVSGAVVRATNAADSFNAENAKIYFLVEKYVSGTFQGYVTVEVKTVEDLAGVVGANFEYTYSGDKWNADVVYVHVELD